MITSLSDIEGIKGEYFYHLYSCHTRLWFYHRNVSGNPLNEHVLIGKYVDETTFSRESKKIVIEGVCAIDFIREGEHLEVHEVKKGRGDDIGQEMQVQFYMFVLRRILYWTPLYLYHLIVESCLYTVQQVRNQITHQEVII